MTPLKKQTRAVYEDLHREQYKEDAIYQRHVSLTNPAYFGVANDFFQDKTVLDAGCGNNANAARAFLEAGAQQVVALDVGTAWMEIAREALAPFGGRFRLVEGDVLALPFADAHFDFVHCSGVLHHVSVPEAGFRELARVTAPGGRLYVTLSGMGQGIVYEWVNLLRDRYREDTSFRAVVDNLTADQLAWWVEWLLEERSKHEETTEKEKAFFRSLFDKDFVITVKDHLQVPTCHRFGFTRQQIEEWFAEAGFAEMKRLTRYPRGLKNIRRFLAPLYQDYENPLAQLLFGDGFIQMIGVKQTAEVA